MVRGCEPGREDHEFDPRLGNFVLVRCASISLLYIDVNLNNTAHLYIAAPSVTIYFQISRGPTVQTLFLNFTCCRITLVAVELHIKME